MTEIRMTVPMVYRHQVEVDGRLVRVVPFAHRLLFVLLVNRGRFMAEEELITALWPNPDEEPDFSSDMIGRATWIIRNIGIPIETVRRLGRRIPLPGESVVVDPDKLTDLRDPSLKIRGSWRYVRNGRDGR